LLHSRHQTAQLAAVALYVLPASWTLATARTTWLSPGFLETVCLLACGSISAEKPVGPAAIVLFASRFSSRRAASRTTWLSPGVSYIQRLPPASGDTLSEVAFHGLNFPRGIQTQFAALSLDSPLLLRFRLRP